MHSLAREDLDRAYLFAARHAPETAERWAARFEESLASLNHNPQRCALARERRKTSVELREFHFGKRPNVYRVVFSIEELSVHVLRILRAQRRPLTGKQIEEASETE
ncbi:MAG TPA: type II toxin-antitoxin system RelE/ParE family toxin [Pirellulales bacterium]|nr:type II toxin-antitoxin system RelE/ParE family toxin [Pirellulales bacterium]